MSLPDQRAQLWPARRVAPAQSKDLRGNPNGRSTRQSAELNGLGAFRPAAAASSKWWGLVGRPRPPTPANQHTHVQRLARPVPIAGGLCFIGRSAPGQAEECHPFWGTEAPLANCATFQAGAVGFQGSAAYRSQAVARRLSRALLGEAFVMCREELRCPKTLRMLGRACDENNRKIDIPGITIRTGGNA